MFDTDYNRNTEESHSIFFFEILLKRHRTDINIFTNKRKPNCSVTNILAFGCPNWSCKNNKNSLLYIGGFLFKSHRRNAFSPYTAETEARYRNRLRISVYRDCRKHDRIWPWYQFIRFRWNEWVGNHFFLMWRPAKWVNDN